MYTFIPGPSQVYPAVRQYLAAAFDEGWLSAPHRGERFTALVRQTVGELKARLNIPQDYFIFFTSSATECWEIIAQSLTAKRSFHLYNGSFGEKWLEYAKSIQPASSGHQFGLEEVADPNLIPDDADIVCITQNETSTATQLRDGAVLNIYNRCQQTGALLAVDVTSSLGGIQLKHIKADVWFASVQKCFGMPAGLGLLICSPRAIAKAKELNERGHYNSLTAMHEKMLNHQTTHTPNVLAIYLLCRVLLDRAPIKVIDQHLRERAARLYQFFEENSPFTPLVQNPETRSTTVIALQGQPARIEEVKRRALAVGLTLGGGYGPLAKTTIRIANFPALPDVAYEQLMQFFTAE
ncbi:aminotransferase class V-fold PLP-dependent enzyme [Hymenobacter koreensis]|uniref:phosphoserine transaminase n=1 Tax=Hymenobacter koreensis TaxID=1084523 RepID=A0ABP8J9Z8_9BACT